jgi:hypothetical protein
MRNLLHSLLVFAITLVYVVGYPVAVEFEHSHEVHSEHGHLHGAAVPGDDHHSHDHGQSHDHEPAPSPDAPDGDDHHGEHHHTHVVSIGADMPFAVPSLPRIGMVCWSPTRSAFPDPDACPDGPCYPLIKPPRLG